MSSAILNAWGGQYVPSDTRCNGLNGCVPPEFTCWNPNPHVRMLRGGAFGRRSGHEREVLMDGAGVFVRDPAAFPGPSLLPGEDTARRRRIGRGPLPTMLAPWS